MQDKAMDFRRKEVINITDGKRLGYVQDVCADLETGKITSIIVPGSNKFFSIGNKNDIIIPWNKLYLVPIEKTSGFPMKYEKENLNIKDFWFSDIKICTIFLT